MNLAASLSIWQVSKNVTNVVKLFEYPTAYHFFTDYASGDGQPFVIRGKPVTGLDDAFLLQVLGNETVQLIEGSLKEDRLSKCVQDMTWSEFLSQYKVSPLYLVSQVPPQIRHPLYLPPFLSCGGLNYFLDTPIFWLSGNQTKSVIHRDGQHNWHCVISGQKMFLLWSPENLEIATPEMGWTTDRGYGEWSGLVDVDDVDIIRFPGWLNLHAKKATLASGECIYIPQGWFHYVESKHSSRTSSFHVWFDVPPVWIDFETCAVVEKSFSVSQCAFEDDSYKTGNVSMGRIPGRASVC